MYPNLYYLFKDLFGLDIPGLKMVQSFGFFVAVAFLLCAWVFARELMRKEKDGLLFARTKKIMRGGKARPDELFISGIIGFAIGFKLLAIILEFHVFLEDTQSFLLSLHGNIIGGLIGAAAGAYLKYREKEAERIKFKADVPQQVEIAVRPHEHVGNMTLLAAVAGLCGAKLFDIFENFGGFMSDPWGTVFSFSGLTMYGGLIVGGAAVLWYARSNGLKLVHVMDACAPGLMLAYGVGRIGCHIAGDGDWGIVNLRPAPSFIPQWAWSYSYPHNVINAGVPIPGCEGKYCSLLDPPVYPTPFYEATLGILFFFVLWSLRKRILTPGVMFSVYLVLNGLERFFIEKIRVNNTYSIAGMHITQAEIISTLLFLLGLAGIWYFRRQNGTPPLSNSNPGQT